MLFIFGLFIFKFLFPIKKDLKIFSDILLIGYKVLNSFPLLVIIILLFPIKLLAELLSLSIKKVDESIYIGAL